MPGSLVVSNTTPTGPLVNNDGTAKYALLKWMQNVGTTVNGAFDAQGRYQGPIGTQATIDGRKTLSSIVQNIGTDGVVEADGLPSATDAEQGAVVMPAGAVSNVLGSAAIQDSSAFDPAGAAATAQSNAQTFATGEANTAQGNAEAFATVAANAAQAAAEATAANASNLTSGTVPLARLPGITVTIITAALDPTLGSQGSMDFVNGILVSQVQAT